MKKIINRPDVAIIVLTRNPGKLLWSQWLAGLKRQTVHAGRYLVMDSSSTDGSTEMALEAGLDVYTLDAADFNHGSTRQLAADLCAEARFLVYLTQDAVLEEPGSLESILSHFDDAEVGLAYGRHVPRLSAGLLEQHARSYTYPDTPMIRDRKDLQVLGFRAAFSSDVYAVYRVSALRSVGGFPEHIIVSEDSYVSARLLLAGWKTVYAAESRVRHSHHYSLLQTFRRYFDVGVFHASEAALLRGIGKPDKEAWVYVRSLIRFLVIRRKRLLPMAALMTFTKLLGFRLGKKYAQLPPGLCRLISLQKAYWQQGGKTAKGVEWTPAGAYVQGDYLLLQAGHEEVMGQRVVTSQAISTVS